MTVSKILSKLVGRILETMPLSVLIKLSDRKIDRVEVEALKKELFQVISSVLEEITDKE